MAQEAHPSLEKAVFEALDIIGRAWSQVELINMAAEACNVTGAAGNAISWGCISVQEQLDQVKRLLRADEEERGSRDLTEMLAAYKVLHDQINQSEEAATDAEITDLHARAMRIICYRPGIKYDERRKAEFLFEYTEATLLTEAEQNALIASLLPVGGAA